MNNYRNYIQPYNLLPSRWLKVNDIDWCCITKNLTVTFFKKGMIVYNQGDSIDNVYLVKNGRVCLSTISSNGQEKSFFIAESGCIFGELSAIDKTPNIYTSLCVIDSHIYIIPRDLFILELSNNLTFSNNIVNLLVKKMRIFTTEINHLVFKDAKYRVLYAIIQLIDTHATTISDGYLVEIRFTHQQMANLTGLSRVSVSQILSNLINDGIIEKKDSYLVVKDLQPIVEFLLES